MDKTYSIQEAVRQLRNLQDMTQDMLAKKVTQCGGGKCAPETISRFETRSEGVVLTVPVLFRILNALDAKIVITANITGTNNDGDIAVFEIDARTSM
jgi:transcriptional regulator with XRE-family HTH domain